MATTMGMSTSSSRVNVGNANKTPPKTKVTANTAHGASMEQRGSPDNWTKFGHGIDTKKGMMLEEYGKGGATQARPSPDFSPKSPKPEKL